MADPPGKRVIGIACKNDSPFEQAVEFVVTVRIHGGPMPEHSKCRKTVRAQVCFSDELPTGCPPFELPDGRMMMEVELDDITLLIVRAGGMDRKLYDEWNRYLDRVTTLGIWSRDPSRKSAFTALLGAISP